VLGRSEFMVRATLGLSVAVSSTEQLQVLSQSTRVLWWRRVAISNVGPGMWSPAPAHLLPRSRNYNHLWLFYKKHQKYVI